MAKRDTDGFSIAQLKNILATRESELKKLTGRRKQLQGELETIDARIAKLGGNGRAGGGANGGGSAGGRQGGRGGKRAKNEMSLVATLEAVLTKAGKPMSVSEIVEGVQAAGYKSSSSTFRAIVNQTLIKERKRFASTGRGIYQMK
jgi:DNA-binding transcriptional MerR regulator